MSVSVSTTAGTQVTVSIDGATQLSFTTEESSVNVVSGTTASVEISGKGPKGDAGPTGPQGPSGSDGADGADGQGVPAGGDQYQVLRKVSGTDYDTEWSFSDRVTIEVRFDEATSKGDPLYITGYNNGQNRITVAKADAADSAKMPSIGLAKDDYSRNDNGQAVCIGSLEDIDTQVANDFQEGDVVYVASGGGLTNVKPTGTNLIQNLGKVGRRQQNNGEIVVMAIGRSNDVPNIPDGQIWIGNGSGVATPTAFGMDLDPTPQLGGDLDVNGNKITSASNGDITIDPDGTGAIILKSDDIQFDGGGVFQGKIKLYESDVTGSNFVALQAPLSLSADTTYTLPSADGTQNYVLQTNGSGILSWAATLLPTNATHEGTFELKPLSGGSDALLALYDDAGDNYIILRAPDVLTANTTFVLPAADGSANQVLKTDGSGNLSFVDQTTDTNTNLGNSDQTLSDDRTIDVDGNNLIIENSSTEIARIFSNGYIRGTGRLIVDGNGTVGGVVRVSDADSSNYVDLQSPTTLSGNIAFTLPSADGTSGQVIQTDGSGNLSFASNGLPKPLATLAGRFQFDADDDNRTIVIGNSSFGTNYYIWNTEVFDTVGSGTVDTTTQSISNTYGGLSFRVPQTAKIRWDWQHRPVNSSGYSKEYRAQIWSVSSFGSGIGGTNWTLRADEVFTSNSTTGGWLTDTVTTTSEISEGDYVMFVVGLNNQTISATTYLSFQSTATLTA